MVYVLWHFKVQNNDSELKFLKDYSRRKCGFLKN